MKPLLSIVIAGLSLLSVAGGASYASSPQTKDCEAVGELNFICGPKRPEDIVVVEGERWLITSGMAVDGGLHLIDVRAKTWRRWQAAFSGSPDSSFPDCGQPPAPGQFIAHGLALVPNRRGVARLYVTGHGNREAIEIFDVQVTGSEPTLVWRGCLRAPMGVDFNSVAATREGVVLATVLHLPGKSLADAFEGKVTGAVFEWRPGYRAFREVAGASLPANNGIAVSRDGKTVYVAASAARQVVAFRRGTSASWRKLWTLDVGNFLPDNLRWGSDGRLYTAGLTYNAPQCGGPVRPKDGVVDLVGCPRGFVVAAISPRSRTAQTVLEQAPVDGYAGAATAVPAGGYLWMSSFAVNRLAYRAWPTGSGRPAEQDR